MFRDKHFVNSGMFTDQAEEMKVILIVPGKSIYDFTKDEDLEHFQEEMRRAKADLKHVKLMNEEKNQKVLRGLYGGALLPAPYVIDKKAFKDQQRPIIYRPWLEPALDLFEQFKRFDFSLSHICLYIESKPFLFPVPSFEDTEEFLFKTRMKLVTGGYTLSDISTIRHYLSNLTLGGYAKAGKDKEGKNVLIANAFDAAIPSELLDASYAAITGEHIDGTPFEGERNKRIYTRHNPLGCNALLHGLITSNQGHTGVQTLGLPQGGCLYHCYKGNQEEGHTSKFRNTIIKSDKWWSLPAHEIDRIVLERLFSLAQHDVEMADRVKAAFEEMRGGGVNEVSILKQQIEMTRKRERRIDGMLKDPDIPLSKTKAIEYTQELTELENERTRLLKKLQTIREVDPQETISDFYDVLVNLPTALQQKPVDVQKQIISKLIKKACINNLSPHLFRLYIVWQEGIATRPDVALLWRCQAVKDLSNWSEEENELLRLHYPYGSLHEIMQLFPKRSRSMIQQQASILQIPRKAPQYGRQKIFEYSKYICYADLEAAKQFAETEEDKAHMDSIVRELAERTFRGEISAYWPLPVNIVGFSSYLNSRGYRPTPAPPPAPTILPLSSAPC